MKLLTLQEAVKTAVQQQKNSQDSLPLTTSNTTKEISLYKPGQVDPDNWALGLKMLISAFPRLSIEWFDVLKDMVSEEKFGNKRFMDAVKHVIKNCPYPEPTIAQILGYDKKIKTFTYEEVLEQNNKFPNSMKNFKPLKNGKWIRIEDADKI